jgi:hypothetical protein
MSRFKRLWRGGTVPRVAIATAAVAIIGTPLAVASAAGGLLAGQRNPGNNLASSYNRETEIIGNIAQGRGGTAAGTGGFTTRQSNKSNSGGGAIYGCRAKTGTNPCVEAVNLSNGNAFQFVSSTGASSVGALLFGSNVSKTTNQPPFVTNGTGLVKNLNADMVGGKHASDLVGTGQLLFAVVDATGKLGANRGATAAAFTTTPSGTTGPSGPSGPGGSGIPTFTVTFGGNVASCAYTATPTSLGAGTLAAAPGPAGTAGAVNQVIVTESGSPTAFNLQVTC